MKLLLDQNLSNRLLDSIEGLYPDSAHVRLLGLEKADDSRIWEYARDNGYVIVTRDSDFYERTLVFSYPPKVIWITSGNSSTRYVRNLLINRHAAIHAFQADSEAACLELID